ncbi:MAG: polysaccharide export protein [Alphaproteobacteria bacterium]|nr:polysaccharide export protein [Alphaproteobacteria bacterium]
MSAPSRRALRRSRGLLAAVFALAACDSDTTQIVQETGSSGSESPNLVTTGSPDGGRSASTRGQGYKLGPNDRLRIIVFGQPTLTGEFTVDGNGMLSYPLIGNIDAGGLTVGELQQAITRKLEPDYPVNPNVSAEVVTRRPFYVIGEVQKPGTYPYVTQMTALNAVALAGGFTMRPPCFVQATRSRFANAIFDGELGAMSSSWLAELERD